MSQLRITLPIVSEHHEFPVKLEAVSLRDLLKNPDSAAHRWLPVDRRPHGPFDLWELRNDFLSWPPEHWEGFVEMAGNFGTFRISRNDFTEWQRLIREALLRDPREWRNLDSQFDRNKVRKLSEPLP
jgi:hypothetical protein